MRDPFFISTAPVRMNTGALPHHILMVKLLEPGLLATIQAFASETGAVLQLQVEGDTPEYALHYTVDVRGKLEWQLAQRLLAAHGTNGNGA
jgi:hypothetical protein